MKSPAYIRGTRCFEVAELLRLKNPRAVGHPFIGLVSCDAIAKDALVISLPLKSYLIP